MARRRRPVQNRLRNRRQVRSQLRQIHRAVSLEPRRVNIPADPPAVNHSFVHSNIIPIFLKYDNSKTTTSFTPGTGGADPTITFGKPNPSFSPYDLRYTDLYNAWVNWTGHTTTAAEWFHGDICVAKICYWGPAASELTSCAIGLTVDIPAPGSSASVTDVGTTVVRARTAMTLPCSWQAAASELKVIRIDCDNEGTLKLKNRLDFLEKYQQLGIMHVTLNVRMTKST